MITPFYSGADLARAATRKGSADSGHSKAGPGRTVRALLRHVADALKKAPLAACRELTCRGTERHSGRPLSWCSSSTGSRSGSCSVSSNDLTAAAPTESRVST